ncbi:MAG: hypothetical protein EBZ49_00510 [Proteobacteria bacterium]|nr:hypothetical protein [Pseudomonadota bacterium]
MKCFILLLFICTSLHALDRGIVDSPKTKNSALLVSAANGLPGLEYDIKNLEEITTHKSNNFFVKKLQKGKGTASNIAESLFELANDSTKDATYLFYFTGHGSKGSILTEDKTLRIEQIRQALVLGRQNHGPMKRLVFILDSCFSGSLIDPLRNLKPFALLDSEIASQSMLQDVIDIFETRDGEEPLYQSLLAFVSAQSDETCLAGSSGSAFTVALKKAWIKGMESGYTINQLISETKKLTNGSHPAARLVPSSLGEEKLYVEEVK